MTLYTSQTIPKSVVERLMETNPGLEIWWDSSPLVYSSWAAKMVSDAPVEKQGLLEAQLKRLYDPENAGATLFSGVTTNPPLSHAAMKDNPDHWADWIRDYCYQHDSAAAEDVFWALYKEIVRLGALAYMPVFEKSGYLKGYLSGQVDPRRFFDEEIMLQQALELSALAPNVMIKIPGTQAGVRVLRELTRRGVPTNCTAAYTVPQFVTVAEAVQAGLLEARAAGVDLTRWRSVVTYMSARWENAPDFDAQAADAGVELSSEDRRWAGVAIFKQAHRLFRQRAYPSKMLICSVRMGPTLNGRVGSWHLEETAGADAVFTLPPSFLGELFTQGEELAFESRVRKNIPAPVMERLQRIPYFVQAYEPDGLQPAAFDKLSSLVSTHKQFSAATQDMVSFVAERMPVRAGRARA